MTFRRGATLPVADTLGHADTCDLGPTAGNGFYTRWPDDLALLTELGVSDVRLTFDWARFQPKPGEMSGAWIERYEHFLEAARAIGLTVWGSMYDAGVPRWFANEGGLDDTDAVTAWWPRWIERIADRFGDRVDGWIPFAEIPADLPDRVWTDTWTVLAGERPVVASVDDDRLGFLGRHAERLDRIGLVLSGIDGRDADVDVHDGVIDERSKAWRDAVERCAESVPRTPIVVSRFVSDHRDPDTNGLLVGRLVDVLDEVDADGIDVEGCLIEPAIAGPERPGGLVDTGRRVLPAATAFLDLPDRDA